MSYCYGGLHFLPALHCLDQLNFLWSFQIKSWILEGITLISLIWYTFQPHVWYLYQIAASWSFTPCLPLNNNPKSSLQPSICSWLPRASNCIFDFNSRRGYLNFPEIHTHSPNCYQVEWFSPQQCRHSTGANTKTRLTLVLQVSDLKSTQRIGSAFLSQYSIFQCLLNLQKSYSAGTWNCASCLAFKWSPCASATPHPYLTRCHLPLLPLSTERMLCCNWDSASQWMSLPWRHRLQSIKSPEPHSLLF